MNGAQWQTVLWLGDKAAKHVYDPAGAAELLSRIAAMVQADQIERVVISVERVKE